ncbi:ABC transporter ATP-binding protein [Bacillus horti]|uniref:Iron(III) transport system ATP-binding protein/putative spermidine/putrescine transport system ATP-binding protein n=1 Tax=Caldalkalibacillus horti TaxID=77523 RepID=A0ABT9VXW2_9BACI|nr:ABC transporter ATP-binding protein [Bacillus horti]MDQ0165832.1 iron(III) transport system ATP-binding protein/putative spermidine/putrescine transport system ATP-binding protein [Bacillus horti]
MSTILEVHQLQQKFNQVYALRDVSFSMQEGEIICILGPSGCGKSTLLQQIAGIQQPYEGEIYMNQTLVANKKRSLPPEKRQINMVFQDYALWPHMSVYENIVYGLKRQKISAKEREIRVNELVELLNLHGLLQRLPAHLSGGQQQRIGIARALATKPRLLLMDEPLSNLDIKLRMHMRNELSFLLRKLGVTVLYVTHDMYEAFALADRLMILKDGLIEQFATPKEVFETPKSPWVAQLLGYMNQLSGTAGTKHSDKLSSFQFAGQELYGVLQQKEENAHSSAYSTGQQVDVFFHPEDIELVTNDWCTESDSTTQLNRLQGQVTHKIYEGRKWRVFIQLTEQCSITVSTIEEIETGRTIQLQFPTAKTFIYPS